MILAGLGVIANLFLGVFGFMFMAQRDTLLYITMPWFDKWIIAAAWASWLISIAGLLLLNGRRNKNKGKILVIIGSIMFLPLGLAAMFGARAAALSDNEDDVMQRRRLAWARGDDARDEDTRNDAIQDAAAPLPGIAFRADGQTVPVIILGGLVFAVSFYMMLNYRVVVSLFGLSIAILAIGIWRRSTDYICLGDDSLRVRLAVFADWHTVLYTEITSIEVFNGGTLFLTYCKLAENGQTQPTKIKIELERLREKPYQLCMQTFRAKLPQLMPAPSSPQ